MDPFLYLELLKLYIDIVNLEFTFILCGYGMKYGHVNVSPKAGKTNKEYFFLLPMFHNIS